MSYNPIKLYEISDHYISYLMSNLNNPSAGITPVYSNHIVTHTRKYLALQIKLNDHFYYVPLSSGRSKDYTITTTGTKKIRDDVPAIWRISGIDKSGNPEVKATILFGSMIPAPPSAVTIYDVDGESDENYKNLVLEELRYISANREKIEKNAKMLHMFKIQNRPYQYLNYIVDFLKAENLSDAYIAPQV